MSQCCECVVKARSIALQHTSCVEVPARIPAISSTRIYANIALLCWDEVDGPSDRPFVNDFISIPLLMLKLQRVAGHLRMR